MATCVFSVVFFNALIWSIIGTEKEHIKTVFHPRSIDCLGLLNITPSAPILRLQGVGRVSIVYTSHVHNKLIESKLKPIPKKLKLKGANAKAEATTQNQSAIELKQAKVRATTSSS